jgi:hypothetical protein
LLPLDLHRIEQALDSLFAQVREVGGGRPVGWWSVGLASWLLVTGAAVRELIRAREPGADEPAATALRRGPFSTGTG